MLQYSQLSENTKVHIKATDIPLRLKLTTKKQSYIRALALILLAPLLASLTMAVTLDGMEQTFYQFVAGFLILLDLVLWLLTHTLVLDKESDTRYFELSFMGKHLSKTDPFPLSTTELLLRRFSKDHQQFELKIDQLSYPIGNFTETLRATLFVANHFDLQATEQISHFPQTCKLDEAQLAASMLIKHPCAANDPIQEYPPLWQPINFARLLLPLPYLLMIGIGIKLFGGAL